MLDEVTGRGFAGQATDAAATAPVVRPFRAGDAAAWDAFVRAREEGTFFHLAQWRRVLERSFGHATHYLLAERDGAICGVLPLAEVTEPAVRSRAGFDAFLRLRRRRFRRRERARCAHRACLRARALARRRPPRTAQPTSCESGLAVQGAVRDVSPADQSGSRGEPARDSAQAAGDGAQGRQAGSHGRAAWRRCPALRDVLREPAQSRHAGVLASLPRGAQGRIRRGLRDPRGHAGRQADSELPELLFP